MIVRVRKVIIHTDGSCKPNPGRGGWAAIMVDDKGKERVIHGSSKCTTNNRMEVKAVLRALLQLDNPVHVAIYSDSRYVINAMGDWINGSPGRIYGWLVQWEKSNWKDGKVKNLDLWAQILIQLRRHQSVKSVWVKGHNGDVFNERCHQLAHQSRMGYL